MMRSDYDIGLSGDEMTVFCGKMRNDTVDFSVDDYIDELVSVLDYTKDALRGSRAYLKPLHTPTMLCVARNAKDIAITPEDFGDRVDDFFEFLLNNKGNEYSQACIGGSAKRIAVQTRLRLMSKILNSKPQNRQLKIEVPHV